jgi:hypothetical protein
MEYEANKGRLYPKHHVYAIDYYSSFLRGLSVFIRALN